MNDGGARGSSPRDRPRSTAQAGAVASPSMAVMRR
jgi:hypothetical protein